MREKVLKTIETYGLLSRGDRCILAVSGGADSMALLYVLSGARHELGIQLRTVHVHHGLRGEEADRDAMWVEKNCRELGIPCEIKYVDVKAYVKATGDSVEEAARILRYRALFDAASAWDVEAGTDTAAKVAVAHNLGDNAETILMQMARGSGLKGLGGIDKKNGRIIRPLLEVKRSEIERYLTDINVSWVTDSTNLDDEYTRNKIRHRILPELEGGVNSAAAEHIAAAGELISQAYEYIRSQAQVLIDEHADMHDTGCRFPAEILRQQPQIVRSTIVMLLLARVCGTQKDISSVHIGDVIKLIDKETGKYVVLPYGLRARREYGHICIEAAGEKAGEAAGAASNDMPQDALSSHFKTRTFPYAGESVPTGEYTKWFDYDKINTSVVFRYRRTGDYIMLGGTGRKPVNAYMTDRKIPKDRRDNIPLAAAGNHVLWIVGYRISEEYKVTSSTVNVLEITYEDHKGEEYV